MESIYLADFLAKYEYFSLKNKSKPNYLILDSQMGYTIYKTKKRCDQWRNEDFEITNANYAELYNQNRNLITCNYIKYNKSDELLETIDDIDST